ncbi:MAG: hypothetical protein LC793_18555, partial [Thermomicrobia bacterium]|nr:hypothetical protein [Thermomicrobia bacterium]
AQYIMEDGRCGFPASGIKKAMGQAALLLEGIDKIEVMRKVRVPAHLLAIESAQGIEMVPEMVRDVIRNPTTRGAALVYRPYFREWRMVVPIIINEALLSIENAIGLLEYAGQHIGIGNWRPDRSGDYGVFRVDHAGVTAVRL